MPNAEFGNGEIGAEMNPLNALQSEKIGGRDRDRTGDPLLAKQVLSQLSYTPIVGTAIDFKAFAVVRKLYCND